MSGGKEVLSIEEAIAIINQIRLELGLSPMTLEL
jgi:hypothetical protein